MNEAEQRLAAYLDANTYTWAFEPDYAAEFGLRAPPTTDPDFLVSRAGARAVVEVRQFEATRIRDRLATAGGHASLDSRIVYGSLRSGIREKAEQLRPFARLGVPLIVALANPLGADVMLDHLHVPPAMFGNPSFRFVVDPALGGPAEEERPRFVLEDYGVFRSPVFEDGKLVIWENRYPYVSAVAVVHERLHSADWREELMQRYPAADRSLRAATRAATDAMRAINAAIAAGEEPGGAYRWVDLYELDGEDAVPVPVDWFDGERDQRFGFTDGGGYGRRPTRAV